MDDQGRYLTVTEAADRLNVKEPYVRRLVFQRRIEFVKFGPGRNGPVRITEGELQRFVERSTVERLR